MPVSNGANSVNISDKHCPSCKLRKPIAEFYVNKSPIWGKIRAYCKMCELEKSRRYKKSNPEKMKLLKKKWDLRNKDRKREHDRKYKFKVGFCGKYGLSIPLLRYLYLSHPYCEYCSIALNADEVSIDHKTPVSRGGDRHDLNNLAVCCRDCNFLKHTRTYDEFKIFVIEYSKRFRENTEPNRTIAEVCDGQGTDPINAPKS